MATVHEIKVVIGEIKPKIGMQLLKIENYEKSLIVYVKQIGLASHGDVLITNKNGRKWLSIKQLNDEYVEAF